MENRDSIIPEPLTADDFTDIKLISAELDEVNREKRYRFECKVRAEPLTEEQISRLEEIGMVWSV